MFGQPSAEETALQQAIDNDAPEGQIKDLLARYKASQKAKQDKLKAAQENLRAVLSVKQEAQATLMGLVE
jgi:cell division protein FtsL